MCVLTYSCKLIWSRFTAKCCKIAENILFRSGWVGLGRVGSGRVGSGRIGSGRVDGNSDNRANSAQFKLKMLPKATISINM